MADANPYTAPDAELAGASEELYQPSIFSFQGRLGRLRYLAYGIGVNLVLMIVMVPLMGATAFMGGDPDGMSVTVMVVIGIFYIATFVVSIMFGKRRLNDLNRSGWWFLLFIIPLVNLALIIYLLFFPGTDGPNNHGAPAVENSTGVLILAWMLPVIMILGIVAAVAVPMFFAGP
jgi:uncharacterized membrane protein YhaH (DUF805 family)